MTGIGGYYSGPTPADKVGIPAAALREASDTNDDFERLSKALADTRAQLQDERDTVVMWREKCLHVASNTRPLHIREAADWLDGFTSGYTHETAHLAAGREIIAALRRLADKHERALAGDPQ